MIKYICNDCKRTFYEPKTMHENMGEFWGAPAYDSYDVCPYCWSEDFDEWDEKDDEDDEEEDE